MTSKSLPTPPSALLIPSPVSSWARQIAPLLCLVALFVLWQLGRLHPFAFSNDEGIYLMWTRLARQGFALYGEVWCDQPPLMMWSLAGLFGLFGESVELARAAIVGVTGLGLLALAGLTWRAESRPAAMIALVCLSLSPFIHWYGRAVMSDVPATCLLALALLAAVLHPRPPGWLAFSAGLLLGASLMVKLVALPIAPVVVGALVLGRPWRAMLRLTLWWGLGVGVSIGLNLAWVDVGAALGQIIGTLAQVRDADGWSLLGNGQRMAQVLDEGEWGLLAPALVGLLVCLSRPTRSRLALLAWFSLAALAVSVHQPLYNHHLAVALFPLVGLAAIGLAQLGTSGHWRVAAVPALVMALLATPSAIHHALTDTTEREAENWAMLSEVQLYTQPNDWIITDNSSLAFRAGLRQPPYLADTGGKRYMPELLPTQDWLRETAAWQPQAILFTRSGQTRLQPYLDWVNHTYHLTQRFSATRRLWTPNSDGPLVHLAPVYVVDGIGLHGFSLAQTRVTPGEGVRLGLFWFVDQALDEDYHIFAHLVTRQGRLVTQHDSQPAKGRAPTSQWEPGQWIIDLRLLPLPADLPADDYYLDIGLYHWQEGVRVGDALRLPQAVRVDKPVD